MKEGYDTFKKEEKWPKFTTLKRDTLRQYLQYLGYILSVGVLYLLSSWLKSVQIWSFSESPEGDYILVEEAENYFEIVRIMEITVSESSLNFSKPKSPKKLQVIST